MSRRLTLLAIVLTVFAFAGGATAQIPQSDCLIGVFADAEGTINVFEPTQNVPFNLYVVMFLEGLVNGVAYDLLVPKLGEDIFLIGESFGALGRGLNILSPGGYNVALGECAIGFGAFPISVAMYTFVIPNETTGGRSVSIGPNKDWDPEAPIFSVCTGDIFRCTINDNLLLTSPVDTDESSFGAVKNLFRN